MALLQTGIPLRLIKIIRGLMLVSKKEPVFSTRPGCHTLLYERPEGSNSRARAYHDNGYGSVLRKLEFLVVMKVDASRIALGPHISNKCRAHPFFLSSESLISYGANSQMDLVRVSHQAGGDRIQPPCQRPEKTKVVLSSQTFGRKLLDDVDPIATPGIFVNPFPIAALI